MVRGGAATNGTTSSRAVTTDATADRCTAWTSWVVPPETIRVYREAYGRAKGTVQAVSFRKWTEDVLGTQMPGYYPIEALKANAIAVKQYGWYYVMHYRGGRAPNGACYDVADAGDGFYRPEVYDPSASQLKAVAATWPYSLRKRDWRTGASRMFLTGYRSGAFVKCGTDSDGFRLYQHSAFDCAKRGMTWEGILRTYMEPRLEIVDPGIHNVLGSEFGDAVVLEPAQTLQEGIRPRVYSSTGTTFHRMPAVDVDIDPALTLGTLSADVTNDRRADLLVLQRSAVGANLLVLAATDVGYADPVTWWSDSRGLGARELRLVAGDFDGDGVVDAGLLTPDREAGRATLWILRSLRRSFAAPTRYWSGPLDYDRVRAYGADATGDGRADLVVERDLGDAGLEYLVAASRLKGGALDDPRRWYRGADLRRETTRTAIGDYDRDGRDDIILAIPDGDGIRVVGLKVDARTSADYVRSTLWKSGDPIAIGRVKLSTGDFQSDGRSDALLMVDGGSSGTRFVRLKANDRGTALVASGSFVDAKLEWSTARTF